MFVHISSVLGNTLKFHFPVKKWSCYRIGCITPRCPYYIFWYRALNEAKIY